MWYNKILKQWSIIMSAGTRVILFALFFVKLFFSIQGKDCQIPPKIPNAYIKSYRTISSDVSSIQKSYSPGTLVYYRCHPGYYKSGFSISKCLSNGKWSRPSIRCIVNTCSFLNQPINGWKSESAYTTGSKVEFGCHYGYALHGPRSTVCQGNGQWTNQKPVCKPVECSRPQLLNGQVSLYGNTYLDVVQYSCDDGYSLIGDNHQQCGADGSWSGSLPLCRQLCPKIEESATLKILSNERQFVNGSIVIIQCSFDDHLKNETVECLSGNWSITNLCNFESCNIPQVRNGFLFYDTGHRVRRYTVQSGSSIVVACNHGYIPVNFHTSTCFDGHLIPELSSCIPLSCKVPEFILNSHDEQPATVLHGLTLNLTCHDNGTDHNASSVVVIRCMFGDFHPNPMVACRTTDQVNVSRSIEENVQQNKNPKNCVQIIYDIVIINSTLNYVIKEDKIDLSHGSTSWFYCRYNNSILLEVFCDDGEIVHSDNDCPTGCKLKGQIRFSVYNNSHWTKYGLSAHSLAPDTNMTIKCHNGFLEKHGPVLYCTPNGLWQFHPPFCVFRACPLPVPVTYIVGNESNIINSKRRWLIMGNSIQVKCKPGYSPNTWTTKMCTSRARWNSSGPWCLKKKIRDNRREILVTAEKIPPLSEMKIFQCYGGFMYLGGFMLKKEVVTRSHNIRFNNRKVEECMYSCSRSADCRSLHIMTLTNEVFYCAISDATPVQNDLDFYAPKLFAHLFAKICQAPADFNWILSAIKVHSRNCTPPTFYLNTITSFRNMSANNVKSFPDGSELLSRCALNSILRGPAIVYCRNQTWSSELPRCHQIDPQSYTSPPLISYEVYNGRRYVTDCDKDVSNTCSVSDLGVVNVKAGLIVYMYCKHMHSYSVEIAHNGIRLKGSYHKGDYYVGFYSKKSRNGVYYCSYQKARTSIHFLIQNQIS